MKKPPKFSPVDKFWIWHAINAPNFFCLLAEGKDLKKEIKKFEKEIVKMRKRLGLDVEV